MHRIRQSINYYEKYGWKPIIISVDPRDTEAYKDETLLETIDSDINRHIVRIPPPGLTRKIGLGSIALRSLIPIYKEGNALIEKYKPDLIFFSTTQFPIMILGRLWKKKWNIPYVLDFQDPWHTEHYMKLPKNQRPPKYWFSYRLNKFLEPAALLNASGLISVTEAYIKTFHERYPLTKKIPYKIIPFGASEKDIDTKFHKYIPKFFDSSIMHKKKKIVYTGVINNEMLPIIELLFQAFDQIRKENILLLQNYCVAFIGTNYGSGKNKHSKLADLIAKYNLQDFVFEYEERLGYIATLQTQKNASILLLCGTTDKDYIASKLAPYMLSGNPILSIYHGSSALVESLNLEPRIEKVYFYKSDEIKNLKDIVISKIKKIIGNEAEYSIKPISYPEKYSAEILTEQQTQLFNAALTM
jgi:hypothetical protein